MSRQQRRAAERQAAKDARRQQFEAIHGHVLAAKTVGHLWRTYRDGRFRTDGMQGIDPAHQAAVEELAQHAFYAGAASMFELVTRVAPDDVSEDVGVEMLSRLQEELETYARGRSTN
jgi:hypothetical protein